MRNFNFIIMASVALSLFTACKMTKSPVIEDGVSYELAQWRKSNITQLKYDLKFNIPGEIDRKVEGSVVISFFCKNPILLQIDFKAPTENIKSVKINGKECTWRYEKEHIIIDGSSVAHAGKKGKWEIEIEFTAPDISLNRREDFLYTLLVPDRARTLFPCFDQPDLKANYKLELNVPKDWLAVSNASVKENIPGHFVFNESEPLSTYLFSFVAGKFKKETAVRGDRIISFYHRENDPVKLAQIPEIFDQVFEAIAWQERYTGMKFPFEKYDFIVIPGFQFGGMEHAGATLYNERLFLKEGAGIQDKMSRYSLIAHETSHMWFGDCVTMKWFDEVWTKEVFANFFAAKMVSQKYGESTPGITSAQYARAAYAEDRTMGATPIKQKLDNLKNAGLIYSNIVYDKAPLIMNMLEEKLGEKKFQDGLRIYLNKFAYGNAEWDDLINIFDSLTDEDLKQWSHNWMEERGMPVIASEIIEKEGSAYLKVTQNDPRNPGIFREQNIKYSIIYKNGTINDLTVDLKDSVAEIPLAAGEILTAVPNVDAKGYGYFKISDPETVVNLLSKEKVKRFSFDETFITSTLINLNETFLNGKYKKEEYQKFLLDFLSHEKNSLLFSQAADYLSEVQKRTRFAGFDEAMRDIINLSPEEDCRRKAFSLLLSQMQEQKSENLIYSYFKSPGKFKAFKLSEEDLTSMSYELAIRFPEQSGNIVKLQRSRITNPDRIKKYDFISRAVAADRTARDTLFNSFLKAENRSVEPWTITAIMLLNHRSRHRESVNYIQPGLAELEEIQQTGDIFFPGNWINALLSSYPEMGRNLFIRKFFYKHPDFPPMLRNKILLMIQYNRNETFGS